MKKLLPLILGLFCAVTLSAQSVSITEAAGWFESAFVKWTPASGADSYNVYYSGNGVNNQKLDPQLIRRYSSYYRADAIGLAPGSYTLKVVPVTKGTEGTASTTSALTVKAHDRAGFAFSNSKVPGAYNANGTPKNGAVVLYITEKTKNTVSLDVTGATTNPCVGLQAILDGVKKGKETRPFIIRIIGSITDPTYLYDGDIVIENSNSPTSFITLEGVGEDAVANSWGIRLKNASNIEIRNLGIMNVNSGEGDNIGLQQNDQYVWVHHNDFFYGDAGSDSDQAKGDGALDCKKSTYVTFSYNHFWDTGKTNLLGLSEGTTEGLYITYHHNWYDHSDSRHPRVRFYSAHVYNNYYDGIAKYGIGSTLGSSVFAEGNYFRNCKYPMLTSMQGSDVWNESKQANDYKDSPTFSKEDGGTIKAFNNYIEGANRFVAHGDSKFPNSTTDFDAYVVSSKSATVPSSVKSAYGANSYNNFDANSSVMYSYAAESPEAAKATVMAYAGRMNGGDFSWAFNNAVDDASYSVNIALKAALVNYQTALISVQGDGSGNGGIIPSSSSVPPNSSSSGIPASSSSITPIEGGLVHNFTLSGNTSSFFNITGNLSTSKGTVVYNSLTLTQCLKIESSTKINFSTQKPSTLTLVFNADFSGSILINGDTYSSQNGVLVTQLQAGSFEITKGATANLYYMSLVLDELTSIASKVTLKGSMFFDSFTNQLHIAEGLYVKRLEVIGINGEVLFRTENNRHSFDLSHFRPGVYLIRAQTNTGLIQQKIYKK